MRGGLYTTRLLMSSDCGLSKLAWMMLHCLLSSSQLAEVFREYVLLHVQDGFQSARETYNTAAGMQALYLDDHPKRKLSSLSLAGCSQISGKGLQALSKASSKTMRQLNISRTMISSLQLLTKWVGLDCQSWPQRQGRRLQGLGSVFAVYVCLTNTAMDQVVNG